MIGFLFQWDAFSIPELRNFLRILDKEEAEQREAVVRRYEAYRQRLQEALREHQVPTWSPAAPWWAGGVLPWHFPPDEAQSVFDWRGSADVWRDGGMTLSGRRSEWSDEWSSTSQTEEETLLHSSAHNQRFSQLCQTHPFFLRSSL